MELITSWAFNGVNEVSVALAADEMTLRTTWESKRGQYKIRSGWNAITHKLRVQIGRNKVSMKSAADGMAFRTSWEFKLVEMRWISMSSGWNGITHFLRVQIGRNEVSIKSAADGMELCTNREFQTRSIWNEQRTECDYSHPENSNWLKRSQYQNDSTLNGIKHILRVQIGHNEVSIKLAADGMALRTTWEFKLVKARSVSH